MLAINNNQRRGKINELFKISICNSLFPCISIKINHVNKNNFMFVRNAMVKCIELERNNYNAYVLNQITTNSRLH